MKEFKGRQTINYAREQSVDETCVAFAPMPMPLVKKGLNVASVDSPLDGVKSVERTTPVRPKNLITLANALSNVSKEPVEVILQKLVRDTKRQAGLFSDTSSYYSDGDDVLRGYAFRTESSSSLSEISAPYSAIVFDENFGANIQQFLSLEERGLMTTEELRESMNELRQAQESLFQTTQTETGQQITGGYRTYMNPLFPTTNVPRRMGGLFSRPQSEISESEIPIVPIEQLVGEL
jgi:hypothetical protein